MATVWPPEVADKIGRRLESVHITGSLRTLSQDIAFGIDQLVEIAIRALSPAVNDTFTALTCIDWLGDSLCKIAVEWHPQTITATATARSASSPRPSATSGWCSGRSRRSARRPAACPRS